MLLFIGGKFDFIMFVKWNIEKNMFCMDNIEKKEKKKKKIGRNNKIMMLL